MCCQSAVDLAHFCRFIGSSVFRKPSVERSTDTRKAGRRQRCKRFKSFYSEKTLSLDNTAGDFCIVRLLSSLHDTCIYTKCQRAYDMDMDKIDSVCKGQNQNDKVWEVISVKFSFVSTQSFPILL